MGVLLMFLSEEEAFGELTWWVSLERQAVQGGESAGRLDWTGSSGCPPCRAAGAAGQARNPSRPPPH